MDNNWLTIENVGNEVILKKCSKKATGEITIPDGVTSIDKYAFAFCQDITRVNISSSVTSIGEKAFWGCSSLESILVPRSVTSLGKSVFEHCLTLRTAIISSGVTHLNKRTFANCKKLRYVNLPTNITLGNETFRDCECLTINVYDKTLAEPMIIYK